MSCTFDPSVESWKRPTMVKESGKGEFGNQGGGFNFYQKGHQNQKEQTKESLGEGLGGDTIEIHTAHSKSIHIPLSERIIPFWVLSLEKLHTLLFQRPHHGFVLG